MPMLQLLHIYIMHELLIKVVTVAGLATEFMTKTEAKKYYGKNGPSGYEVIVPDMHRAR